jgi:diguanylate cyclase (GGDEF)-like protein
MLTIGTLRVVTFLPTKVVWRWTRPPQHDREMERKAVTSRLAAFLVPALGAVIVCTALSLAYARSRHSQIQQLRTLPADSVVHLVATVIDIDRPGARFWIQDDTGAIPLPLQFAPSRLRLGETVYVVAVKTGGATEVPSSLPDSPALRPASEQGRSSAAALSVRPGALSPGSVPPGRNREEALAIADAAPGVQLRVVRVSWEDSLALALAVIGLLWILILRSRSRAQEVELQKFSNTSRAIRELSVAVQNVTDDVAKEGTFDGTIPVDSAAEVASLGVGFNTMLAEIQKRYSNRKDLEQRLQHLALIDDLTGLPNRRLLTDRLIQSISRARRDSRLVALIHADLDGFKLVNDSFGHNVGDALLAEVALRLNNRFRESDTIARLGGDEFAVVLDQIRDRSDAQAAAEGLVQVLSEPFAIGDHSIQIGACVGIAFFPEGREQGQLLQQASCALYAARRKGRNSIVRYSDDLGTAARERLTLERELQYAIARGEISIHYQPEYDIVTNTIVRFEALARWTHPILGQISPVSFIPVAEESGLIFSLGSWIMETACLEARRWQEISRQPIQIGVNVSTVQFARDTFFEEVAGILHRSGLHPSLLQLELTESATVAGIERASEMMRRFHRMGVTIAVDDFGTGYSCLSYLPKLAFDALKLDRSFVNNLLERRETRSFVQSILTMAHDLGMKVIVEGIDTMDHLSLAKSLGADEAQGYLLGEPSPDPLALVCEWSTSETSWPALSLKPVPSPAPLLSS